MIFPKNIDIYVVMSDIVNKIMRAGNMHEKEYIVTVNKEITMKKNQNYLQNCSDDDICAWKKI